MRAELAALGAALDALEQDSSITGVSEVLSRRDSTRRAFLALQGSPAKAHPGRAMREIAEKLTELLGEVDAIAADPIGQRARLAAARERITGALSGPSEDHPRTTTITLISVDDEG